MHTFVIPDYLPPTLNVLLNRHWTVRHRASKECKSLVIAYSSLSRIPAATGKRRVSVTFSSRRKIVSDEDARVKLLLDALVCAGLLVDDSPQWCELGRMQSVSGQVRETVVLLEEIEIAGEVLPT